MKTKRKKILIIVSVLAIAGILIGGGTLLYLFNMPHVNVQDSEADYALNASALVSEYLTDYEAANEKYLNEDGDSKILEITGTIAELTTNFNGNLVVLLKQTSDLAGVSCTFVAEPDELVSQLKIGQVTKIKGIIRSGAGFDNDLELYEPVVLEKCTLIK